MAGDGLLEPAVDLGGTDAAVPQAVGAHHGVEQRLQPLAVEGGKGDGGEAARLGQGARLGWTGWMSPNWAKTDETWRKDARFHVASRLAHGRAAQAAN